VESMNQILYFCTSHYIQISLHFDGNDQRVISHFGRSLNITKLQHKSRKITKTTLQYVAAFQLVLIKIIPYNNNNKFSVVLIFI